MSVAAGYYLHEQAQNNRRAEPRGQELPRESGTRTPPDDLRWAERQALSRELHDWVAHSIAVGLNCMEMSDYYASEDRPEKAQSKRHDATEAFRQALGMTRALAARVRTPRAGGPLVEGAPAVKAPVAGPVEAGTSERFDPEVFLILREAVGNALTHSGADDITIRLQTGGETMTAAVEDDGTGPEASRQVSDDETSGLGLQSMLERAALLGGSFTMAPRPSGGTRVDVTVPMAARR